MSYTKYPSGPKSFGTTQRKSFVDEGDKSLPGPGTHTPFRFDKIVNPQWAIGEAEGRDSILVKEQLTNPSPSQYHIHESAIHKNSVKHKIPLDQWNSRTLEVFHPLYNPDNATATNNKDPSYSFSYRFENDPNNGKPGNHFTTSQRQPLYGDEAKVPGPGKYMTLDPARTTKISFPRSDRNPSHRRDPPAHFYEIGPKTRAKRHHRLLDISTEKHQKKIFAHNQNPGPNHYNPYEHRTIPNGVFNNSVRNPQDNPLLQDRPSPDKYTGEESLPKATKKISFIKSIRNLSEKDKKVPGPGTYEPMTTLGHIGGTIGKTDLDKQKQKKKKSGPGASSYSPKIDLTKHKVQSTIVFRGDRVDFSKTITGNLGPGAYKIQKNNKKSELGIMGQSKRPQFKSPSDSPGAGSYDILNQIGKLPKYYTSPKKMTENGYSTFHQQQRFKLHQKMRLKELSEKDDKQDDRQGKGQQVILQSS